MTHTDFAVLDSYAAATLDPIRSASLEAHLVGCEECRTVLAQRVSLTTRPRLEQIWDGVVDRLDAPRVGPIERALCAIGVPEHAARLLAATPALHASWLLANSALLAFAVLAAHAATGGALAFLALAPLLPLAGVATAYGPGVDPTYEIGMAAPLSSFRLLFIRAASALVASIFLVGLAALAVPSVAWSAAVWLLPALALSLGSLALGAVVNPLWASGGIGVGWLAIVTTIASGRTPADAVFGRTAQVTWAALAVVAAIVITWRREHYDLGAEREA
jgi:hypothetical protein